VRTTFRMFPFPRRFIVLLLLAANAGAGFTAAQEPPKNTESQDERIRTPMRIRVGGNVASTSLINQVMPVYPAIARSAHISGTVMLHAIISKDGSIETLEYISGPPLLMKSAMDAVRQWRYKPTTLNGRAVEVDTTISVVFTLGEAPPSQSAAPPQQVLPTVPLSIQSFYSPALIHKVVPIYPAEAKEKHIEGNVMFRAFISSEGSIRQLEFLSGPPELEDAAMDAVKQWHYKPLQMNGASLEIQTTIVVLFSLTKDNYKAAAASDYPISVEVFASSADLPPPKHLAAARAGKPPIPDTLEGIQKQTEEAFEAWRAGDQKTFEELVDGFVFEDPTVWLSNTFGADRGASLVPDYEIGREKFKRHMARIAEFWGKSSTSALRVEYSAVPKPPAEAGQPDGPPAPLQALSIENFRFYVTTGQTDPGDWVFSFVYVDGAFRAVGGTHPFWNENWRRKHDEVALAGSDVHWQLGYADPSIIEGLAVDCPGDGLVRAFVSPKIQATRLKDKIEPVYPEEAKRAGINGVVLFHAIIAKDGSIEELTLEDGDPLLAKAAEEAVRKWRYEPLTYEDRPAEVDTAIAVEFKLPH